MRSLLLVALVLFGATSSVRPHDGTHDVGEQQATERQRANPEAPQAQPPPPVVPPVPAQSHIPAAGNAGTPDQAATSQNATDDRHDRGGVGVRFFRWVDRHAGLLQAVAGFIGLGVALLQAWLLVRQAKIADTQRAISANQAAIAGEQTELFREQNAIAKEQNAIATRQAAIAAEQTVVAARQATIVEQQFTAQRATERGIATVTHRAPGLIFSEDPAHERGLELQAMIRVINNGRTPITLTTTSFIVRQWRTSRPAVPQYGPHRETPSVLAPGDHIDLLRRWRWTEFQCAHELRDQTLGGWGFMVIGYVDYIDIFGDHHRSGYAREYAPLVDERAAYGRAIGVDEEAYANRNNLRVIFTRGYNYFRQREPGDGHDWDDTQRGSSEDSEA